MGKHDAVKHLIVCYFFRTRLNHCHKVRGGGDCNIHFAFFALLKGGVNHIFAVDKADNAARDGAVPRNL